jgi:hypothetical protein
LVKRKIDSIVWQTGRGNSYVARACDLTQDGKMDRTKLTDYKLEATLMDLISADQRGLQPGRELHQRR